MSTDHLLLWYTTRYIYGGCFLIGQALTVKIEMRFPGLLVLKLPWDIVDFVSSAQSGTGLVEMERDTVFDALHMGIQDPCKITDPGFRSGFSAAGYRAYLSAVLLQVRTDIDPFQHGFMHDGLIGNRKR